MSEGSSGRKVASASEPLLYLSCMRHDMYFVCCSRLLCSFFCACRGSSGHMGSRRSEGLRGSWTTRGVKAQAQQASEGREEEDGGGRGQVTSSCSASICCSSNCFLRAASRTRPEESVEFICCCCCC